MANASAAQAGGWFWAWFSGGNFTDWALVVLALAGLIVAGRFLAAVTERFPKPDPSKAEFAATLIKGTKQHAETLKREFATSLWVPGIGPESGKANFGATDAVAHVRHLRMLLRGPVSFIRHARSLPLGEWPGYPLSHAFAEWSGVVESIDSLLADMFHEVTAAVATGRWQELRDQYAREEQFMLRDLSTLPGLTAAVEKAAKPFLKKPKHKAGHGHDEHHDDHGHH